ncbi:hypothetical protein H8356DRAFT_1061100 [Neocallimastix lanati (nom. inval.)]|uniref:Uncharacterized protein n=1 Tax=Neocallimastix californiae TaxID=1754190 RepID=A0A1Y2BWU1_9FUNG|nr:hypothetical protein H8356DRAFT_1061100 [Neocallimastix sp. JGI-2020a]ORY39213.1 hypothetical protein LY90DRAFT_672441 [Neocallimastix californiae]|eukprot:ORY39213.1 hypothetical protein LY90DRAFT_672441 [Neocallimastix californiae]
MEDASLFNIYMEKQRKFITLVKEVQNIFNSKEYQKQGYSFKQFTRMKWDISQAQAYRYIMCAKVIDQLDEFEIKPSYESLCKSLNDNAKSPIQMKLLWSKILQKTNNRPDCINSTHIQQYWKELCMDKRYSNICHYIDEYDIKDKIEKSLNKLSTIKKCKQLNQRKEIKPLKQKINKTKIASSSSSSLSESISNNIQFSPALSKSSTISSNTQLSPINLPNYTNTDDTIYTSLSPINNSIDSVPISNDETLYSTPSYTQYIPFAFPESVPSTQILYYLPIENDLSNNSLAQLNYLKEQLYIYY